MERLVSILEKYTRAVVLRICGNKVVISERGARVLGLFTGPGPNLLWVNPDLEKTLGNGGWNLGGLRVWVSPERNFYYKRPEDFQEWLCPEGMDPDSYQVVLKAVDRVSLEGRLKAYDYLVGRPFKAWLRRDVRLLGGGRELRLLVRESLVAEYEGSVNLWALAQVSPGAKGVGTVVVPVRDGAKPIHYFGLIPGDRIAVASDHVSFKIDGLKVAKLGVKPEDLPEAGQAAIAYVTELDDGVWGLLLMKTSDAPRSQEECLDVAKADPEGPRGTVQSYNSGPNAWPYRFGEIELHFTPAVRVANWRVSTVEYEVLAYTGPKEAVLGLLKKETEIGKPALFW